MRNRVFRENQAKDCEKIEELRRIWCEETDRARQASIDELSMHPERNPTTVNQLLTQIQDVQNKVNSLSDAREFYDPEAARSSGATHVPGQPSTIPSPRTMPCRDSGLKHDTRNIIGTSRNVFERLPNREGRTSTLFNNSKNLASSSQELRPDTTEDTKRSESEMRREPQNWSILVPRFHSGGGLLNYTCGTYSHSGMIHNPRFPISELHLGQFADSVEFQSWKVNFKNEVCSKSADPHLTMHWIKEVEIAESTDDLMTSQSIVERNDCTDYEMRDAMIASALKRLLDKHVHFRKRVRVEEERAHKHDRFFRGRQESSSP